MALRSPVSRYHTSGVSPRQIRAARMMGAPATLTLHLKGQTFGPASSTAASAAPQSAPPTASGGFLDSLTTGEKIAGGVVIGLAVLLGVMAVHGK